MYRNFLRLLSAVCLLFTFWPVFRFSGVTIFDWLTLIVIVFALPYTPKERGAPFSSFRLATYGIVALAFAGILSAAPSYDSNEHLQRVIHLTVALAGIIGLAYVLVNRKILTVTEALSVLCLSAAASSAVCILQGQFGILTGLIPDNPGGVKPWTRMVGLTEWPIEAGQVSDFGVIIGMGLAIYTRKSLLFLLPIVVNLYSLSYSASLTAVFALLIAFGLMCLYAKTYKPMLYGAAIFVCGIMLTFVLDARRLTSRLEAFSQSQGNYSTVQTREIQWSKAIDMIGPGTLLIGNGFSTLDLPYKIEIHNGVLASVFHFGILGLTSQVLLIGFFAVRLRENAPRELRSILLGCTVIFMFSYMTGPALSRRSLWVPPLILAGYLTAAKQLDASRYKRAVGGLGLAASPELPVDS